VLEDPLANASKNLLAINSQLMGGRNMRSFFRTTTVTLALMLCLTGLVLSGTAFAKQCVDNGDGTVTDNGTGLMWEKAPAGPMKWDAATSYCSNLIRGGHSDWRLPSRDELMELYHSPCKNMMDVPLSSYWSSTPFGLGPLFTSLVNFSDGDVSGSDKSDNYYVRAVREAQ